MDRKRAINEIISYFQSSDYLCDIYNDYGQTEREMCEYDYESSEVYINRRSKADAQREAHRQGFHLRDEELDFHFPVLYVDFPKTQLTLPMNTNMYPEGLTEFGKKKYKLIEETLFKFRQLGYTMDDKVYRALVVERSKLEEMCREN